MGLAPRGEPPLTLISNPNTQSLVLSLLVMVVCNPARVWRFLVTKNLCVLAARSSGLFDLSSELTEKAEMSCCNVVLPQAE